MTRAQIRNALGHNGVECRVVIHRDGRISRHGSPDTCNRSTDYWHDCGNVEDPWFSGNAQN